MCDGGRDGSLFVGRANPTGIRWRRAPPSGAEDRWSAAGLPPHRLLIKVRTRSDVVLSPKV